MKFSEFLEAALSDSGKISYGRFSSLIILLIVMGWDTAYVVFTLHKFGVYHFNLSDILPPASTLMSQMAFIAGPYGITKASAAMAPKNPENGQK